MCGTMAFMLETQWLLQPTEQALSAATFEKNYVDVWQGLRANFNGQP
jgi:homogentisate 1,2-dioxygenase